MELALYCPIYGYYEREQDTIGRRGDYSTSATAGRLFGELLAFQFAAWLDAMPIRHECRLQMVEAGAHDGRLAYDILAWLRHHRQRLFHLLEYWIVEPSARRKSWQKKTLAAHEPHVRWCETLDELQEVCPSGSNSRAAGIRGVIFCNELLDSFPVHRFGWDAAKKQWFEWGVALRAQRFVWEPMAESTTLSSASLRMRELLRALTGAQDNGCEGGLPAAEDFLDVLPDGYILEFSPGAEQWWQRAARTLECGKLLGFDYGLTAEEILAPERPNGTLRAYSQHHASDDILARPGEQDLTAHVNFTALRAVGEAAGLTTEALATQEQFLTRIALNFEREPGLAEGFANNAGVFRTLTHPEHMGRAFRVLLQSRG